VLTLAPLCAALALLVASGRQIHLEPAILMALALMLAQSGVNLLDAHLEYARGRRGHVGEVLAAPQAADAGDVLARHGLTVLRTALALLALGVCAGIPLLGTGGLSELALGVFGLAVAFFYSATSYALKRLPGGEVALFLALGPAIVVAAVLAQKQPVTVPGLMLGCAMGLFGLAVVEVVRVRDALRPALLGGQARTDSTRGERWVYGASLFSAYLVVMATVVTQVGLIGAAAALLSFPSALLAISAGVRARSVVVLDAVVRHTLGAYAWFTALLVGGLLASEVVRLVLP
jgi:1,4-dihydroxy-2-naphthoate octaprenyltransferase